jgi:hypothetical protein
VKSFISYLESIIPKGRAVMIFPENNTYLIGYFKEHSSLAEVSRKLPQSVIDKLKLELEGSEFVVYGNLQKIDKITGKVMNFTQIYNKSVGDIESHFQRKTRNGKIGKILGYV